MRMNILHRDTHIKTNLTKIKIADLTFGRENQTMIRLLAKRGTAIREQNWEHMRKIENKINVELKNNYDVLTTPTSCVITFEEEEGANLAIGENNKTRDANLLGQRMVFKKPYSPTDIVWEHREKKGAWKNHIVVFAALIFLLLCSFVIVF